MRPMCNTKFRKTGLARRLTDILLHRHAEHKCVHPTKGHRAEHWCCCGVRWSSIVERIAAKYGG